MTASAFEPSDSPSFRSSFNQFRQSVLSLSFNTKPLRCDSQQKSTPKWEDGVIMQQGQTKEEAEKSEIDLKRELADCKRCEKWRDELVRESEPFSYLLTVILSHEKLIQVSNQKVQSFDSCFPTFPSSLPHQVHLPPPQTPPLSLYQSYVNLVHQRWQEVIHQSWEYCCVRIGSWGNLMYKTRWLMNWYMLMMIEDSNLGVAKLGQKISEVTLVLK